MGVLQPAPSNPAVETHLFWKQCTINRLFLATEVGGMLHILYRRLPRRESGGPPKAHRPVPPDIMSSRNHRGDEPSMPSKGRRSTTTDTSDPTPAYPPASVFSLSIAKMTTHVDYHHVDSHLYSSRGDMPALRGQDAAWNMATSIHMHGRQLIAPCQSLLSSAYYVPFAEELSQSHYDLFPYTQLSLTAAPAPGAIYTSSAPSTPTPSPIYSGRDIIPKNEIMEIGHFQPTSTQSTYAAPIPTPGVTGRTRCEWEGCTVELDDLSHSGIRRHFRDFHNMPRGSMVRCQWGGQCRSEEMLYDNIAKHIAECHLKSMRTECKSCGNSFARNDTLKRHLNAGCPALGRRG